MKPLIFIAGGSKGLGQSLCNLYLKADWDVIEFSRSGEGAYHIDCDFADVKTATLTFQQTFQQHKTENRPEINLIINAASLAPFGSIASANAQDIQKHLDINITTAVMLIHQFSQVFEQHPATKCMAYISSGAARRDIEGLSLYCASKAALERFVLTFNQEQKRQKHPVNSMVINPGVMDTGMQETIRAQKKTDFPLVDHWSALHENKQLADSQTIAKICQKLIKQADTSKDYHVAQDYI